MVKVSPPSIVISASSRRSGSTWLQRIIHASTDIFVWGEPFPLVELLSTIFENFQKNIAVQSQELENFLSNRQDPTIWKANINPPSLSLKRTDTTVFQEYDGGRFNPVKKSAYIDLVRTL